MLGGLVLYFLLAIVMFITAILFLYHLHIKLKIDYKKTNNSDIIILIISMAFGIIKYRIELPFLDFVKRMDNFAIRYRIRFKSGKEIRNQLKFRRAESMSEFFSKFDDLIDCYYINKNTISYFSKKTHINNFSLNASLGFDDAYITGISCGVLYVVVINFLAFLKRDINLQIQYIKFEPVFNKEVFDLKLNCIIDIKLGHIIIGIKKLIKTSRGSEISGATYPGSYENNYGKY